MTRYVDYDIQLDVVLQRDREDFIWFHPRVAAIPGAGADGVPDVVMTLQKHLRISDYPPSPESPVACRGGEWRGGPP